MGRLEDSGEILGSSYDSIQVGRFVQSVECLMLEQQNSLNQ